MGSGGSTESCTDLNVLIVCFLLQLVCSLPWTFMIIFIFLPVFLNISLIVLVCLKYTHLKNTCLRWLKQYYF